MKIIGNTPTEIPVLTDDRFDKIEQFAELVKPLQRWMLENHHPHSKIIIESTGATVVTDEMFIPLKVGD
jgi:hypothetical protein